MSGDSEPPADRVELARVVVGGTTCGIETGRIREVVDAGEATRVPATAEAVEGVVDVDGTVTGVVDPAPLVGQRGGTVTPPPGIAGEAVVEDVADDAAGRLVVLDRDGRGQRTALRVDGVEAVETVPVGEIRRDFDGADLPGDPDLFAAVVDREDDPLPVLDVEALVRAVTRDRGPG